MLDSFLDLVLGSQCVACGQPGRTLCTGCVRSLPARAQRVCPDPCPPGLAPVWTGGEYAAPLRDLVLAHKERGAFSLAGPLGQVLSGAVCSLRQDWAMEVPPPSPEGGTNPPAGGARLLLVPIPSRPEVVRRRGHDPVRRMSMAAARIARRRGVDARVYPVLRQRVHINDQAGLDAAARASNLAGAMALRTAARNALARSGEPVHAVICDDVITTGATAREAQRALHEGGIPVLGVACVAATRRHRPDSLPFSGFSG